MAEPNLALGFLGGMLIGVAAVLLLALNGRIAGISGILSGAITTRDRFERSFLLLFLVGLIMAPAFYRFFVGPPTVRIQAGLPILMAAGLLVGFGTTLGSRCTSGHGLCGIARLSHRSILATITFIVCGMLTVYLRKQIF